MDLIARLYKEIPEIEKKIGYQFKDRDLLFLAFVHRSFYNENRNHLNDHNERLEFLGDSVLELLISGFLYNQMPEGAEGVLSYLRSQLVEASSCALYVERLGLEEAILVGRGERLNLGKGRETIQADFFEALMGAIYLDGGFSAAYNFFWGHFEKDVEYLVEQPSRNWKAQLQDWAQKHHQKLPHYDVISETGPDHGKIFEVVACVGDVQWGKGRGTSKKIAEQGAAKDALEKIGSSSH